MHPLKPRAALGTAALILLARSADACSTAGCSLASRPGDAGLARGQISVEVSHRYLEMDRPLFGSRSFREAGLAIPAVVRPKVDFESERVISGGHQEWRATGNVLQVDVGYGLTSRLALVASLPIGQRSLEHHHFDPRLTANHNHEGTSPGRLATSGVGDAQLTARLRLGAGWTASGAVKLKNGAHTRPDEFGLIADPMQQPGSGATAVSGTLQYATARLPFGVWGSIGASFQASSTNDLGYRMGNESMLILRGSRPLSGALSLTTQAKLWRANRNRYQDQLLLSTGGIAAYLAPGLSWKTPLGATVYGSIQFPLYQKVNELQLGMALATLFGVSRSF
jgi:hypothetical protein